MSKNRPVEFELQERGPERHQQDVRRRKPVDREIAKRRGRIEKDDVIGIEHPVGGQRLAQRIPQLPAPRGHPPDGNLELGPVKVELRPDQVDVRPVRLLHEVGRSDLQCLGQGLIQRNRGFSPVEPPLVLGPQMGGVMPCQQRKDGAPFIRYPPPEDRGHRTLAIEVDHQHPVAVERCRHREMGRCRGLADAALEVRDGHDLGRQALGPPGQVLLGARSFGGEMRAQSQHLVQREPLGPALAFRPPLRQVGIELEHAAEMLGGNGDQVFRDLPGREQPQLLAPLGIHAPARQIGPALCAGGRHSGKLRRVHRSPQLCQGHVGVDVEIGRLVDSSPCHRCLMLPVFVNIHENSEHQRKCGTNPDFLSNSCLFSLALADVLLVLIRRICVLSLGY